MLQRDPKTDVKNIIYHMLAISYAVLYMFFSS
jgi:hypothetical protein